MKRAHTWSITAALTISGVALIGCNAHDPATNNGDTRAGGNHALGGDTMQSGDDGQRTHGVGNNGNQMEMNGLH